MQELVAGVEKIRVALEAGVEQQQGAQPLPSLGMDSKWVCGSGCMGCPGVCCPFQRTGGVRTPGCALPQGQRLRLPAPLLFLPHVQQAQDLVPLFAPAGECSSKDCPFLHADASPGGCPWYDRGFCRQGPLCQYKHRRRVMCANYLVGFCPEGPNCTFMQ
uniref:Cleavage and polyadenylation specificity factor subunit 4 n=1 Tax=Melopsittacus undulatus TaxID=13146 RepID=A0A8C6N7Z2_MELUD